MWVSGCSLGLTVRPSNTEGLRWVGLWAAHIIRFVGTNEHGMAKPLPWYMWYAVTHTLF